MNLSGISLTRGTTKVFDGLNLQLSEQRIGLVGLNGSGKSSLLRVIKGLLLPDSGKVTGADSVGFIFQNADHQLLFPTVMEELCFGLLERDCTEERAEGMANELLIRHGVSDLAKRAIHELSEGQKQLICILSVLMDGPQTILFDEPFSNLDGKMIRCFKNILKDLTAQLIIASHDLELFADFDRIVWLEKGRIQMDGNPRHVLSSYQEFLESQN